MELRILGPVELWADGRRHPLGSPRLRCILACLALDAGRPVPIDALMDRLWAGHQPTRSTIHSYVARVRNALRNVADDARIDQRDHGYILQADPDTIDYHRFRRLQEQATALVDDGRLEEAAALMREAAGLWTGDPLGDLRYDWADRTRRRLEDERRAATIARIKLELRLGHAADLVSELTQLVSGDPFDQRLAELLMRALHDSGQSARALEVYRETRRLLVEESGTEPGRRLRELQRHILAGDLDGPAEPVDHAEPGEPATVLPPPYRPDNLPRPLADFVGREAETEELVAAVQPPSGMSGAVIAIDGMPGVGKTTFAVQLAHRLAPLYPDGRLYLDLSAHGADDPLGPLTGTARLLQAIGVPVRAIPDALEDRAGLWRSHLAGRRVLVLLDDASGHDQIRHLLPGSSPSLVIITSRRRLTGLDGARLMTLAPMPADDSAALLRTITTPEQDDDETAMSRVVRLCAGLPLAIRLAAARLRDRPARTVHDLAVQLGHADDLLDEFEDESRSVRIAFELSYRGLHPALSRAFRLLSLYPGDEFTIHAAAALLGEPIETTVRSVDMLLDARLLEEHARGRYRYHDLLRGYARHRAAAEDGDSGRAACLDRLGEYFLSIAERADDLLRPHHHRERAGVRPIAENPPAMADADEARRRMEMEISGMIAYARSGYQRLPELAHAIAFYLDATARWYEAVELHWRAANGWRAAHDPIGEATAMVDFTAAALRCGRLPDAEDAGREALATYRAAGHPRGEADALDRLGLASWLKADYDVALEYLTASAGIREQLGDEKGAADARAHSGLVLISLGRYDTSILMFERALTTYRRLGDAHGESETLNNLGEVQLRLGHPEDALHSYTRSGSLHRGVESPQHNAIHLGSIGNCRLALGHTADALACFHQALAIFREIGDRAGSVDALDGLGAAYHAMGRDGEALAQFQNALRLSREVAVPLLECRSLRHIGAFLLQTGEYRSALPRLQDALNIARRIGDPYETGLSLLELGECLLKLARTADARTCLTEAAQTLRPLKVRETTRAEERLLEL